MWSFHLLENEDNTGESRAEKKDEQIPGTVWVSWIQLYLKLTLGPSIMEPIQSHLGAYSLQWLLPPVTKSFI